MTSFSDMWNHYKLKVILQSLKKNPLCLCTNLAISMPITFLIPSEWSLVAVLICWLYASNSPSAVHPIIFSRQINTYFFYYSGYNRVHLQWAKWKSNIQVILLEKYDILILKIWNKNIRRILSFYLLQMKEAICLKSPVFILICTDWKIEINDGFGATHPLAGTIHAKSTYSALIKILPVCILQYEQVLL